MLCYVIRGVRLDLQLPSIVLAVKKFYMAVRRFYVIIIVHYRSYT